MVCVTVLSRPGCCLCGTAKMILGRLRVHHAFEVREVDIDQDPELRRRYAEAIPVILVDGEEACRGRVDERPIRRLLEKKIPLPTS